MARLLNLASALDPCAPSAPRARRKLLAAPRCIVLVAVAAAACASDEGSQRTGASEPVTETEAPPAGNDGPADAFAGAPAPAARLSARPIAVRRVPGAEEGVFDLEATRVLAAAVRRATGAVVIDEQTTREAFERCEDLENNCTSPLMNDFVNAAWVVSARVDTLGEAHFASGQVWRGSVVERRSNQQSGVPLEAVAKVGWDLGAYLRPLLVAEVEQSGAAHEVDDEASADAP